MMSEVPKIFESEYRFLLIVWKHEPVSSTELVHLCEEEFQWKKSTTYTMIKKLTEKGVIKSKKAIVTSIVSKDEIQQSESMEFVKKTFGGSLPQFIAAFISGKGLSKNEAHEIQELINQYKEHDYD